MKTVIIDYGSGNLRSAEKSFERSVRELGLDMAVQVTSDADEVSGADRIVLPGVGAFGLGRLDGQRQLLLWADASHGCAAAHV